MSDEVIRKELELEVIKKYATGCEMYTKKFRKKFEECGENINKFKILKTQYPRLKKLTYKKFKIHKFEFIEKTYKELVYLMIRDENFNHISTKEKEILLNIPIRKLKGVYKHAQALKTGYCNKTILGGILETNTITVCITMNNLESTGQWFIRLRDRLLKEHPGENIKDLILIIASKDILPGSATHCTRWPMAWDLLKKPNKIKILFMCSNLTRISDIYDCCESFKNLIEPLRKNIRIIHDEGHKMASGIPAFRAIIEHIIMYPNVLSYSPVTASIGDIVDNDNPLWQRKNLEKRCMNYTDFDNTKSTDPHYSSVKDAKKITFEELKKDTSWKDYGVTSVTKTIYKACHGEKDEVEVEKKRKLEFCGFMKNHHEIEAINCGINVLHLNDFENYSSHYESNKKSIHIISTPCRNIITAHLAQVASRQPYNPIVLSIYGGPNGTKFHLRFIDKEGKMKIRSVDKIMRIGELNEKINSLMEHLKKKKENIERPWIIFGNVYSTAESLTFVHWKYGTIKSNTRLVSTNPETDYQEACRSNYMDTKFKKELGDNWKHPEKYLMGPEKYIKNALAYEVENDGRIDDLENSSNSTQSTESRESISIIPRVSPEIPNGIVAIPVKITIDRVEEKVKELVKIACVPSKNKKHKKRFLLLLKECCENPEIDCEIIDKTGKFDFDTYTIRDFRTFTKDRKTNKGNWKFKSYEDHHAMESTFINSTNSHKKKECELLLAVDRYILRNELGEIIGQSKTNVWWLGYKY